MEKTIFERMKEAKKSNEVAFVGFFNNGKVREDENFVVHRLNEAKEMDSINLIANVLCDATDSYSHYYPFDTIKMDLELGLLYNKNDVDEDKKVKANARPINNVVRFYTGEVNSYLDGERTNTWNCRRGTQGFVDFGFLMSVLENSGLTYTGPETFEEFKGRIISGNPFEISLTANFKEKEEEHDKPKQLLKTPEKKQ